MLHVLIPASLNDSLTRRQQGKRALRKKSMSSEAITFLQVINEMRRRALLRGDSAQSLANSISAIRAFMYDHNFGDDCPVGSNLRVAYYRRLHEHVANLVQHGRSTKYIANRKSLLSKFRSIVLELDRADAVNVGKLCPFNQTIKELVAKAPSQERLAADVGVPLATLKRWSSNGKPQNRSMPMLRRLESYFAVEPGTLVELANASMDASVGPNAESKRKPIAFRQRLKDQSLHHYLLKAVPPALKSEWLDLVKHKVEVFPMLERQSRGHWRATKELIRPESEKLWYCFHEGSYVPSAAIYWNQIASFLGWLSISQESGGGGLHPSTPQSLTWLLVPSRLHAYLSWRMKRSGGVVHSGILAFIQSIKGLTHPVSGYLTQSPHLAKTLPAEAGTLSRWEEVVNQTFVWTKKTIRVLGKQQVESREHFEPIKDILQLPRPMDAVADMIHRMKVASPSTGGLTEAIWSRDLVLIKILASNPLRAKNLKLLTYHTDNSGNLYQTADGAWRIKIKPKKFKNECGAARHRDYDMPIDKSAWNDIERYLKGFRPLFPYAQQLPYVFLSSNANCIPSPWESLNRRVFYLTKQHLWHCPGVGPHAFRYIMGTSILKASPNDWGTAALVLHDNEETVRKHYAHLRSTDGAERMLNLLRESFERM